MSSEIRINTSQPVNTSQPGSPLDQLRTQPDSPKLGDFITRSPSPFEEVIPRFCQKLMWIDLIYTSNEKMREFMSAIEKTDIQKMELPSNLAASPKAARRWCLRITTSLQTMNEPLTILFETYPDLFGYLFPIIQKQLTEKLEKNSLPT